METSTASALTLRCVLDHVATHHYHVLNVLLQVLVAKIHSSPDYLRSGYYAPRQSTGALTSSYYRQLSQEQRVAIAHLLKMDLEFYYQLFPDEEDQNRKLLGLL